jgi:anti-sigma factor RsiW
MSAHAAVEQLSALIDGELEDRERRQVDLHLEACPGCRARLEGLRAAAASLASLGPLAAAMPLEADRDRPIRIGAAGVRTQLERRRSRRPEADLRLWWPALALIALIAGVGGSLGVGTAPAPDVDRPVATSAALEGAPVAIVGDRIFRRENETWREIENGELPAGARAATPAEADAQLGELPGLARLLAAGGAVEIVRGGERIRIAGR